MVPAPPLRASEKEIDKHWGLLKARLDTTLPKVGRAYDIRMSRERGIIGNLVSQQHMSERTRRDRGGSVLVVPLIDSSTQSFFYWMSFQQKWSEPYRTNENFVYHTTSLTVYFGKQYNEEKVQLFRAEWPGLRSQADGSLQFEAQGAGHPHWQFDAYGHRSRERYDQETLDRIGNVLEEKPPEVEDFADSAPYTFSNEELELASLAQRLTKVHFASSTRWADNPWNGDVSSPEPHAQAPAALREILNWTVSTISYIQHEVHTRLLDK